MRKILLTILLLLTVFLSEAKEIAITFDDSPRSASGYFDGPTRAKKLVAELKEHNVEQVAFFSVSKRLDAEGIERLNTYSEAGHIISNHTHSHPDFNQLSLQDYSKDFLLADVKLQQFNNFRKLFRFPYLREGNTAEKRDGMRKLLNKHGYKNAYITLNNYDWYIESLFQNAVKEGHDIDMEKMSQFYVQLLIESIEYYDEMAQEHLGRSPKHVLLLHEMDISALFIGDLVKELRIRGWNIITPDEAYSDDIAKYKVDRVLKFNPGRIGEIALVNGQRKGLWHKNLDERYLEKLFMQQVINH
ncbi:polysaccharide deacetylase family protein [Kangiella shandongensis]|uniref:polysaccharide deacetylase family protein n=1 Tax=Kangiella shandongensis TaxID=2763258 RepID=UPI001CBEE2B5|nr:polysaccharide deacetylase family protein [Kangiella shandongensis]